MLPEKSEVDFKDFYLRELNTARKDSFKTFELVAKNRPKEKWVFVFIFLTNWPVNFQLL